jgi:GntR family transcriptional regulator
VIDRGPGRVRGGAERSYLVLADTIEKQIADTPAGTQLPSESDLMSRWHTSRPTVRAALLELERRFLIHRSRGKGTFVAQRIEYVISSDTSPSWRQSVREGGAVPEVRVLSITTEPPSDEACEHLELSPAVPVFRLERLGLVNGVPASAHTIFVPSDLAPEIGDVINERGSLYRGFRSLGFDPIRLWYSARLDTVDSRAAALLGFENRPALWRSEHCNVDSRSGRPLEYGWGRLRPDVLDIRMYLGTPRPASARP